MVIRKFYLVFLVYTAFVNALIAQSPTITDIQFEPTTCGLDNGSIKIFATSSSTLEYSINGSDYQASNDWADLPSGGYTTIVRDENNNADSLFVFIEPSSVLSIISVDLTPATCGEDNGSLFITHTMGAGSITSSFDGDRYYGFFFHPNLSAGQYSAIVLDETNCSDTLDVEILNIDGPVFSGVETTSSGCEESNGSISIDVAEGTGTVVVSFDGEPVGEQLNFDGLSPDEYVLTLEDEIGCISEKAIQVPSEDCPLYIPNAFSPNGDGVNDVFKITPHPSFNGIVSALNIYSKWGALVYQAKNLDFSNSAWDGRLNNRFLDSDIYIYVLEITRPDGDLELINGDVTVLR